MAMRTLNPHRLTGVLARRNARYRILTTVLLLSLTLLAGPSVPAYADSYQMDWVLSTGGTLPEPTTFTYNAATNLFESFSVTWGDVTFNLLEGGVYQSVNVLPHGPTEFFNALLTGGTWEAQKDLLNSTSFFFILKPSYGDGIDTGYVSAPLVRPETTTVSFGTFTVNQIPVPVPEASTLLLLGSGLAGLGAAAWRRYGSGASQATQRGAA